WSVKPGRAADCSGASGSQTARFHRRAHGPPLLRLAIRFVRLPGPPWCSPGFPPCLNRVGTGAKGYNSKSFRSMEMRATFVALSLTLIASTLLWGQQSQNSGTDVQLRGISAVSDKVAWASGAGGTVLRTVDGGATWLRVEVVGASSLDFRDVQAFDQNTAFVLSIGPGEQSRIYKTSDGGRIWQLQFTNKD